MWFIASTFLSFTWMRVAAKLHSPTGRVPSSPVIAFSGLGRTAKASTAKSSRSSQAHPASPVSVQTAGGGGGGDGPAPTPRPPGSARKRNRAGSRKANRSRGNSLRDLS
ncbi:hypothetical protein B0T24DRAFT_321421 [Lasiosphaeria ovina]|uniref:Secreted protein n=1 Tax=Lasiosphaeria ovina TaxID=92902 RepID=A0AAE0N5F2_9PEZI|nr:hypothetical protein B0T24DRAFT_321421 [Lasiosphaeria ovina]